MGESQAFESPDAPPLTAVAPLAAGPLDPDIEGDEMGS